MTYISQHVVKMTPRTLTLDHKCAAHVFVNMSDAETVALLALPASVLLIL